LGADDDPDSLVSRQLSYWTSQLDDLPGQLDLPVDRQRPEVPSRAGSSVGFEIPVELHARLVALARERGASAFMVLQAALATLLSRMGAGDDIPLGTPVAGRTDGALDNVIGYFVNTLVLRTDTSGAPAFAELVDRVRAADLAAYQHQDVPFERVVAALNPERSQSTQPLFQVRLVFDSDDKSAAARAMSGLPGITVRDVPVATAAAKFDLLFRFIDRRSGNELPAGLDGLLEFDTDLYERRTAQSLVERLLRLLEAAVANPETPIGDFDILGSAERDQLFAASNGVQRSVPFASLHELFETQVARSPEATAVVSRESDMTYTELNARANRLARLLIIRGVVPGSYVAIFLPRITDLLVALLAVTKAGGAYLPLDLGDPPDRVAFMLEDANPVLVISTAEMISHLPLSTPQLFLNSPRVMHEILNCADTNLTECDRNGPVTQHAAAYLIYTSGSSGKPKAVVVEHRSLSAYLLWARRAYPSTAGISLSHSSVSFDLTVTALYTPLISGGCVRLKELNHDYACGTGTVRPTFMKVTPSHLALLAELPDEASPSECLVIGGEPLRADVLNRWRRRHPAVTVVNAYGPTEATVNCLQYVIEPGAPLQDGPVPIGLPFCNTQTYVLDVGLRLVPPGVRGELYVAGEALARGYLGQFGLTSERFIANPFGEPGTRMYRTGDLAKWNGDGVLEFVARADDQVKLRGFRVEPGEIESVILEHENVAAVAVVVDVREAHGQRLIAYVVPRIGAVPSVGALRDHMLEKVPKHMMPSVFIVLDQLPLTAHGKLDHAALPSAARGSSEANLGPLDSRQQLLCQLFAEVLGVADIGIEDDFFKIGGHSLLAIRLISRIRETFRTDLSIACVFRYPNVAALAAQLDGSGSTRPRLRPRSEREETL